MSIRATFAVLAAVLLLMVGGLFFLLSQIVGAQRAYAAAEMQQFQSYKLADELRQSSDDLTRMARTYVLTGNSRYEEIYNRILAIRNGEYPRPDGYEGVYWDLITTGDELPVDPGTPIALLTLMQLANFTDDELAKLQEAQANSDDLVNLEVRAMAAVKGHFADANGEYTAVGAPDPELASALLHGAEYHVAKAKIMAPIEQFFEMVAARTDKETRVLRDRSAELMTRALVLLGFIIAFLIGGLIVQRYKVVRPINQLARAAARAQSGDYSVRVNHQSGDELGKLSRAFDRMSVAIEKDIEEREIAAKKLAQAQDEADSANRAKSAFLANMSHELRTPMNAVIGYSEMLIEEMEDDEIDNYVNDIEKINAAGKHLLSLINDILDLSKIEAGRMDLYLERFDLEQMLAEACSTIEPIIEKNGNQLVADYGDNLGIVRADLTKLRQALFNLLSNASKFTENGTITLSARRESLDGEDRITLGVADTGIGIPSEKLDHIFDEFSQADSTTTRDYGGTGLGLAISRRFCQMMGGNIEVTSAPGEGSQFTIILPATVNALKVAKEQSDHDAVTAVSQPLGGYGTILVVDDDDTSRDLLTRTLESDGYRVMAASSGAECLEMAREQEPDVITLDVMMPGMDGWSVLKTIKSDEALRNIPVIMVSMLHDQEMGFTLGAAEYLTKPVDRRQLLDLARQHTSGKGHVLIVEDDDATRELMRRTFESDGWRVSEAENGQVGLDQVLSAAPDMILLDLMMPVMDGFQFLDHLPETAGDRHIPVFVLTAKEFSNQEREFLESRSEFIASKHNGNLEALLEQIRAKVS